MMKNINKQKGSIWLIVVFALSGLGASAITKNYNDWEHEQAGKTPPPVYEYPYKYE